jgi:hypothetical protein
MLFAAAHHAFELYRWFAVLDETQRAAIRRAADHLETVGTAQSPLLGAVLGVHAWLDQGGSLGFVLRVEFVDLGRENAESDLRRISVTFAPFCEFVPIS